MHCVYRDLFESAAPPNSEFLHDLCDAPRPFVIEPPLDQRRIYAAGDLIEWRWRSPISPAPEVDY